MKGRWVSTKRPEILEKAAQLGGFFVCSPVSFVWTCHSRVQGCPGGHMASFEERPTGSIIASRSWQSFFLALRVMPRLFISAIILSAILAVIAFFVPAAILKHAHIAPGSTSFYVAVSIGLIILSSAIAAPLAVAMHRLVLLDQVTLGVISLGPRHTRLFFVWMTVLQLAYRASDAMLMPFKNSLLFYNLLLIVSAIVMTVVSIHLAMIFPAVATEAPSENWRIRMAKSWRQMHGHSWLFFRAAVLAGMPLVLAGLAIVIPCIIFEETYGSLHNEYLFHLSPLYGDVLSAAVQPLIVALGAAIASWLYAWVQQLAFAALNPQAI